MHLPTKEVPLKADRSSVSSGHAGPGENSIRTWHRGAERLQRADRRAKVSTKIWLDPQQSGLVVDGVCHTMGKRGRLFGASVFACHASEIPEKKERA